VIRRRFNPSQIIDLLESTDRPAIPNVRQHSKLFVLALAGGILLASVLLASPWASRSGDATPFVDALFTAVSAACVTGLVTVDTRDHWNPLGQAIILLLIQLGGLGFMVGASIVLRALQRGSIGLRESMLLRDGAPTLSLREAASLSGRIVRFTFAVEATGALLLFLRFSGDEPLHLALWNAVFLSVSAFCNAGFDLQGSYVSLIPYQSSLIVNLTIMALIQAGALSFVFFADLAGGFRWRRLAVETKLIAIVHSVLLLTGAGVFLGAEWRNSLADVPLIDRPLIAMFQSVAARTAGFASVNLGDVTNITLFSWVAIMFVGGASGSTAGGVKLTTVGVVALTVVATLRGQAEPQVFGRRLPIPLVFRAMTVIALMFAAHFVATLSLTAAEHLSGNDVPFIAIQFETMSALATVGLSTGITPDLSEVGKFILCVTMFFGRIGPLTAAYALQIRQRTVRYRFPEELVRIG